MEIRQIINIEYKDKWDNFLISRPYSQFLQSWKWAEFQESNGNKIYRLALEENGKLIGTCFFYTENLPLGFKLFYCPRGPVFSDGHDIKQELKLFLDEIIKIAKEEKIDFLKIDPALRINEHKAQKIYELGFKKSEKEAQPIETLIININKTENDLLKQMHEKIRYNIKLAERKGVVVQLMKNAEGLDDFYKLIQKTAARDKFKPFLKKYYQKLLEKTDAQIIQAAYENQIIASNIIYFFGNTAYYLHGASDYEFRKIMAPHLLQWEIILEAKKKKCALYDFWGASYNKSKWKGVTRFKQGFCPDCKITEFIGPLDYAFSKPRYYLYKILRRIKNII